jgi:hypothetical protein
MSKGVGSGDKLARGASRATFSTTEGGVTQDKWAQAFDDYNPEEFKNAPEKTRLRSSDASLQEAGDVSAEPSEIIPGDRPEIDGFGN